jgi:membrane protease YdiL (CAAX protease family)
MAVTFVLAFVALLATVIVGSFVPAAGDPADSSGGLNSWTDTTRDFVIVIVLLTPLQAAGEEYAFRGYLTQAFGGLFRNRVAAVVIPAVLFALAHGAQDAPVFVDRLAFGLVAGILVVATGGLEAGIAMHVLNNFLAYGFALAFSDMTSALNPTGGSWWTLPTTLTQSLVYLALAIWAARRMGVSNAVDRSAAPNVLEGSERRV